MNRRGFLYGAGSVALAVSGRRAGALWSAPQAGASELGFEIESGREIAKIPADMMGLSYESTQLGEPGFFSCRNRGLVELLRTLSPHGSLRLGGNTSEFTYFKAGPATVAPEWSAGPTQPKELTEITPEALRELRCFLDATGWSCIYGLNLGTATPERVAEEAAAVADILGSKLTYFQIGNEPNNYIRYKLRPSTWDEKVYVEQWLTFARAVVGRVPQAKLGGPDMGAERAWMQHFVSRVGAELKEHLVEVTDHFYAEGPPTSEESTMQNLLFNKKIEHEIAVMVEAGETSKRPYRMTEVNSCYLGGKPGVSDTMGSALWAGELTLKLLANGFSGVNFHGGSARQIKASLGGTMPGDSVAKSESADSYYTPIAGDSAIGYTARPIFYGMLLASQMAGTRLVGSSFSSPQTAVSGYASVGVDSSIRAAFFNKDAQAAEILIQPGEGRKRASVMRLTGPSIEAVKDVRLGDASISKDGNWKPARVEKLNRHGTAEFKLALPAWSAALVAIS